MRDLQELFASAEGENEWEAELRALFEAGDLGAASDMLEQGLSALDSDLARQCLSLRPEAVVLTGWEELVEAIAAHEGEPVTGVTLAIANEADLAFEKGRLHHPYMLLGLYTDEAFGWSEASREDLLAECHGEVPAWAGYDEDIEVYLDIEGLDALNTALLHHKQRHFFRDANPAKAPARYVEYVLGCWWRALLYQQAVAAECAIHGLPGGVPVVSGMVDMRPEVITIHDGGHSLGVAGPGEGPEMAEIIASDFIQRRPTEEVKEFTGLDLRRRVAVEKPQTEAEPERRGLLARIFGR